MEKIYIGEVEAFELALGWGLNKLPRKNGKEFWHVPSVLETVESGIVEQGLGKDDNGFYLTQLTHKKAEISIMLMDALAWWK